MNVTDAGLLCDLHMHSTASDGTLSPRELAQEAIARGLGAAALTDHNTTAGLPDFLRALAGSRVTAVAGAELTTVHQGRELHLLALFLPEASFPALEAFTQTFQARKRENTLSLADRLGRAGYPISREDLAEAFPDAFINRSHVARILTARGAVPSVSAAFATLLSPTAGFYSEPERPGFLETIPQIQSLGALAVWAHPVLSVGMEQVQALLPQFAAAGLDGVETICPNDTAEQAALLGALAAQLGLLPSGGSDYHGSAKPGLSMMTGYGSMRVPAEYARALQAAALKRQTI